MGIGREEGENFWRDKAPSAQGGGGRKQNKVRTKVGTRQHQVLSSWRMNLHMGPDKENTRPALRCS